MARIYKYIELLKYFENVNETSIRLTFEEIESIIGFKLPPSAYKHEPYWHPSKTHTITKSWVDNGFKMFHVSLGEYVEFKKL